MKKTETIVKFSKVAWIGSSAICCWLSAGSVWGACETQVGGLVVNEIWAPPCIYVVTNDTSLSNVTLLPGTEVQVAGNFAIRGLGLVRAVGTPNAPITIRPAPSNGGGWSGFVFENSAPGSEFDWCVLEGARNSMLRLIRSTVLLRNTVFTNNSGPYGGAIYAELAGRQLAITNCAFLANSAVNDGGAIWVDAGTGRLDVASCRFEGNQANPSYQPRNTSGGAITVQGDARIVQSVFRDNRAHAYTIWAYYGTYTQGGALWAANGNVQVAGCEFRNCAVQMTAHEQTPDTSYAQGGAICLDSGSLRMWNSLVAGNSLSADRGRVYRGSGVYVRQGDFQALNSTFADNFSHTAIHNESGTVAVTNCILFFNYDHVNQISGTAEVQYSNVQGGYPGEGNIDYNPIFDPTFGLTYPTYRLISGSPSIDAGNSGTNYSDRFFPPSQGTSRCDQGYTGGPGANLWLKLGTTLDPVARNHGSEAGNGSFSLSTDPSTSWAAQASQAWLHTSSSDSGSGTVSYSLDVNPNSDFRTGTIAVDGKTFTVTQGPKGYAWSVQFGWIYDAGDSWYHSDCLGWLWYAPGGVWVYSSNLQGWLAITDTNSPTAWSTQFRWFKPPHKPPCLAETTCLGQVYVGTYNGTAIPDGWVVSERFGYVWATGDGKWFYSDRYGWLSVNPEGGIWNVRDSKWL